MSNKQWTLRHAVASWLHKAAAQRPGGCRCRRASSVRAGYQISPDGGRSEPVRLPPGRSFAPGLTSVPPPLAGRPPPGWERRDNRLRQLSFASGTSAAALGLPGLPRRVEAEGPIPPVRRLSGPFPLHAGRPVLLPGETPPRVVPIEHLGDQPPSEIQDWMTWFDGWIDIGAGVTRVKLENVVEMEYSIFRHTDVAANAHHLPFANASFDAVVSLHVEHLHDPDPAIAEIFRVLKPGAGSWFTRPSSSRSTSRPSTITT